MKKVECYVPACDECKKEYEDGDGITEHFQTEKEVFSHLSLDDDWYVNEETKVVLCDVCRYTVEHDHVYTYEECDICAKKLPE